MKNKILTAIIALTFVTILAASIPQSIYAAVSEFTVTAFKFNLTSSHADVNKGTFKSGIMYKGSLYVPIDFVSKATEGTISYDGKGKLLTVKLNPRIDTNAALYKMQEENKKLAEDIKALEKVNRDMKNKLTSSEKPMDSSIEWIKYETKHFVINFTKDSFSKYRWVYDDVEKIWDVENNFYGGSNTNDLFKGDKVDIFISDDIATGGVYEASSDSIRIAPGELLKDDSNPKFVLVHELAHSFQFHIWGKYGEEANLSSIFPGVGVTHSWLLEGQADYIAKKIYGIAQYSNNDKTSLERDKTFYTYDLKRRSGKAGYQAVDWDAMETFNDFDSQTSNYLMAETAAFFIENQYGHDKYIAFYKALSTGSKLNGATKSIFGKTADDLMKEYKTFYGIDSSF